MAYTGPGDIVAFTAWYGLRAYSAAVAAAGSAAVRVRRASDSTETDISVLSNGELNIAALTSFLASTTGTVSKLYDQTGGGRVVSQASASAQPDIVLSALNGRPTVQLTATSKTLLSAANFTPSSAVNSFSWYGKRVGTAGNTFFKENGQNNRTGFTGGANLAIVTGGAGTSISASAADSSFHAVQAVCNGASSVLSIDGTETTGTATGNATAGLITVVGATGNTTSFMEAGFITAVALSSGNRSSLQGNQSGFWGTAPGVTGTLAATEGADAASFAGAVAVSGVMSGTDGADIAAFAGTVAASGFIVAQAGMIVSPHRLMGRH